MAPTRRVLLAALASARPWLFLDNVRGLAIGCRQEAREYRRERHLCLVVTVGRKVAPGALAAEGLIAFPRVLELRVGGNDVEVEVDVQSTAGVGRLRGSGSRLLVGDHHRGSVGMVVQDDKKKRSLVTAGHVAVREGNTFKLAGANLTVRVDRVLWNQRADQGLLRVVGNGAVAGALPDGRLLGRPRAIGTDLINQTCYLFRGGEAGVTTTIVRDVDANVPFAAPDHPQADAAGVLRMRGLVAVESRTSDGDSGSLLFDGDYRPIGTLVGTLGDKDYYSPCRRAFDFWGVRPVDD